MASRCSVATSKRVGRLPRRVRTVAPFAPRLTLVDPAAADQCLGLGCGREQEIGRDARDERTGRAPAGGEQRADRCKVHADRGVGCPRELDRAPAGEPERRPEERVDGNVDRIRALEPGRSQVGGVEQVGRSPVGHEAALAAGRHHHADPARPGARDARDADGDAVGPDGVHQHPAGAVATDRGDQRRPCPERPEPARRVGGRPALDQRHAPGDVRARFEVAFGRQDDVEHQVAEDDDPRRRWSVSAAGRRASPPSSSPRHARHPGARRSAGSRDRRHPRRIAGAALPADRVRPPTMAGSHPPSR